MTRAGPPARSILPEGLEDAAHAGTYPLPDAFRPSTRSGRWPGHRDVPDGGKFDVGHTKRAQATAAPTQPSYAAHPCTPAATSAKATTRPLCGLSGDEKPHNATGYCPPPRNSRTTRVGLDPLSGQSIPPSHCDTEI